MKEKTCVCGHKEKHHKKLVFPLSVVFECMSGMCPCERFREKK